MHSCTCETRVALAGDERTDERTNERTNGHDSESFGQITKGKISPLRYQILFSLGTPPKSMTGN
jgi:hypothetical protein